MQTISEFIKANGGLDSLKGRLVTNGKITWKIQVPGVVGGRTLVHFVDKSGNESVTLGVKQCEFLCIDGLRLAPTEVMVFNCAINVKGRNPEIDRGVYFENLEQARKFYEDKFPGTLKNVEIVTFTERRAIRHPDGKLELIDAAGNSGEPPKEEVK